MATKTAGALERPSAPQKQDPTEKLGRSMLRARLVEDKLASLYRAGRIVGGVYLGQFSQDLVRLIELTENPNLQRFAKYLYLVLPDLSRLNYRDLAIYNALPDGATLAINAGYGCLYTVLILGIALLIFSRRQF